MNIRCVVCGALAALSVAGAPAAVVYVKSGSPPAQDGASWATATATVQQGLGLARPGDEVWVAEGTYTERITLPPGVALYGEFAGTEIGHSQRNPLLHRTVIDGAQKGSVVTIATGAGQDTLLDGFVIRNGSGTNSGAYGGGLYCAGASPTIRDNLFTGNTATASGGAVYLRNSDARIVANMFERNTCLVPLVSGTGGAIYCTGGSPTIAHNVFRENTALAGAAINAYASSPDIRANLLIRNHVLGGNGGGVAVGGVVAGVGPATVADNVLFANTAPRGLGGGLLLGTGSIRVTNNTIAGNSASAGGGMALAGSAGVVGNNIIADNSSGVYSANHSSADFRYNDVAENGAYNFQGTADPTGSNGNIGDDPRLAEIDAGNLHLQPYSYCREAGDNGLVLPGERDIDGQPRIQGAHVDIGADESDGRFWKPKPVIVRVSPSGDDAHDGRTWSTAKRTIQAAIDAATLAGAGEVWVQAGIYNETVTLESYVSLYGGFAGTETSRYDRQPAANVAIIDAQGAPAGVTIQAGAYGTTVDGFTVRNARNTLATGTAGDVVVGEGARPTVSHNTLTGAVNAPGLDAGIASSPTVEGNRITANAHGGIDCELGSTAVLSDNAIDHNGYGIGCQTQSRVQIINNTIVRNGANPPPNTTPGAGVDIAGHANLANNIIAWNGRGVAVVAELAGAASMQANCIFSNEGQDYVGTTDRTGTAGNIKTDPKLVDWPAGDIHLLSGSPCIDAGDSTAVLPFQRDTDGQPRIAGASVDIGADEF